jgi:AbrB family looped-hinge helix DNA binding protein
MIHYRWMKTDTATITSQGQMTVPKRWREQAGVPDGGAVLLTWLDDSEGSLKISPLPRLQRSNSGLGRALLKMPKGLPEVAKHVLPPK